MAGDYYYDKARARKSATAADTDGGGVTSTISAPTGNRKLTCTGIQCSGDKAAVVTIESPASTVLWQKRFSGAFTMSESFVPGSIVGAAASALLVKVSDGTANSEANIQALELVG